MVDSSKIDKETEKKIQELQLLEQNLQNVLMQKQAFQLELNEVENAMDELKKSGEEVFKIVGQVMLKSNKADLQKDLKQRQDLISLRVKSIDTQEKSISKIAEELRKKVLDKIQK
jgi:prefoldin beta subunit